MPHDDVYPVASQKSLVTFSVNGEETVIIFVFTVVLGRPLCSACVLVCDLYIILALYISLSCSC